MTMENTQNVAATAANAEKGKTFVITTAYDSLPDVRLSEHFSLREFTISAAAIRHNINNVPTDVEIGNLRSLCQNVLEPLRRRFGVIRITSGYRSDRVNRLVGGVATSQHKRGEAADLNVSSAEVAHKMVQFVRDNLDFDQLIYECVRKTATRWIHVSYRADGNNRRQYIEIVK